MAEYARLSPHTSLALAKGPRTQSRRIIVNDVTLREGIQVSRVPLDVSQRLRILQSLESLGIPQIQIGYPALSKIDAQLVRMARDAGVKAELEAMCSAASPDWEDQMVATAKCRVDRLNMLFPTADFRLERVLGITRAETLRRSQMAVKRASELFPHVTFSPVDASRSDIDFLKEVLHAVVEAGADRFYAIDTAGVATPEGMHLLVTELCSERPVEIAVHCHNDFGLALANSLASVQAGAKVVDTSINGMGKRGGNASLDEVVIALQVLDGIDTGVRTQGLYRAAWDVAELCALPLAPLKPLVGKDAFDFEVDAQLRGKQAHVIMRPIEPEMIGHPTT